MSEHKIGSEIFVKEKHWRIIRIVANDQSLFEDESGTYIILETFMQLKDVNGAIDFITLNSEKLPYSGPTSSIKALEPIPWRPTNA